ncbi:chaperone protein dnaJ 11, chloroplastic-like [Carica papaya]|uniref:chaperone protein dnaJ 11, chloroplastic-like n=1 Tax=Carica papaya TaxID=3649 RepID=UPI000B8CA8C2|nr:chaperone protein dnaJ 11, chloroplastic-like [Carica papaya]
MASSSSLYEVLGIPTSANCHEIKVAYRRLARLCHPDVVSVNQKETSATQFKKIHAAYSTLSDPDKRADYDRDFYRVKRRYGSSLSSPSSLSMAAAAAACSSSSLSGYNYTCRNWETDQCW